MKRPRAKDDKMQEHKKDIRGGFKAEPYFRYETLAGFIVYFAGEEVAQTSMRPGASVTYSKDLPEYMKDCVESFDGLANSKMYNGGNEELVTWWESFSRWDYDANHRPLPKIDPMTEVIA